MLLDRSVVYVSSDAMRVFTRTKRLRFSRKLCFVVIPVGWLAIFITLSLYNDHESTDKILATELTKAGWKTTFPVMISELHVDNSAFSSTQFGNRTFQVQKKLLLVHKSWAKERSKLSHFVTRFLDGFRAPYTISEADDKPFLDLKEDLTPDVSVGRYSLIVFVDIKTYINLTPNVRQIVKLYCKKFGTGILFFISNHVGYIPEFRIEVIRPQKERQTLDVEVNEDSKLLRITRRGGSTVKPYVQKGQGTRWNFLRYDPLQVPYETVEFAINRKKRRKRDLEIAVTEQATVILDDGGIDGIKKVFFGGGFPFFLHTMLFMDSLEYLSPVSPIVFSLERYLQIDVDDIFIAKTGIRMKKKDVLEMISVQERLSQKITGFKFNLGFSGRSFRQGDDEEDEGDNALIAHAGKFTWFGHLYDHEQPHKHTYSEIVISLNKNEEFAKKHGIPMNLSYMVAPHHSGVYPIHEPLYDAWASVRHIRVTSTEEYPHLKPAWFRRGFIYKGVKVLPRQTCGLFTTTNFFYEIKGGKKALDKSIEGGELFETLLRNPVTIVMTHMTNYGNDQLALYTVSRLVNFVHRWTNLELKYASPIELADIYFNLFPKDKVPVWLSPCDDSRHLQIWPSHKSCSRLPSFLVIGPPFGGLEILVPLLKLHPDFLHIVTADNATLGTSFFNSDNYMKGLDWYMKFFPRLTKAEQQLSYEVSDEYFTDHDSPYRASNLLKSAKILIVLEDPVKRAFNHYQHLKNVQGMDVPNFDDLMKSKSDPDLSEIKRTILGAGHYSEHIARWMRYYNAKQMNIVSVDDLVSRPITVMNTIQEAVHVETRLDYSQALRYDDKSGLYCPKSSTNVTECLGFSESRTVPISPQTKQHLQRYYSRHNQNLLRMNQKIEFPLPKWIHG